MISVQNVCVEMHNWRHRCRYGTIATLDADACFSVLVVVVVLVKYTDEKRDGTEQGGLSICSEVF